MELNVNVMFQKNKQPNFGNQFHVMKLNIMENTLSILEVIVEKLLMFVKEKLKTVLKLSNGITMDIKIKYGSLIQLHLFHRQIQHIKFFQLLTINMLQMFLKIQMILVTLFYGHGQILLIKNSILLLIMENILWLVMQIIMQFKFKVVMIMKELKQVLIINKIINFLKSSQQIILILNKKKLSILELMLENSLMLVEEMLKTNLILFNGDSMEIKIKFGLLKKLEQ